MSPPQAAEFEILLEDLLYGESASIRDQARSDLIQRASNQQLTMIVQSLQSQKRVTRRRVTRFLSDMPAHRIIPLVITFITKCRTQTQLATKVRREALEYALRILTTLSSTTQPILHEVIKDADPKVRLACITPIADEYVLQQALQDLDQRVAQKAAQHYLKVEQEVKVDLLIKLVQRWPHSSVFLCLYARQDRESLLLQHLALADQAHTLSPVATPLSSHSDQVASHSDQVSSLSLDVMPNQEQKIIALSYIQHIETLTKLLDSPDTLLAGIWKLQQAYQQAILQDRIHEATKIQSLITPYATHPHAQVRMAVARALHPNHPQLPSLLSDSDPNVSWIAQQTQQAHYHPQDLAQRLGEHERLNLLSAQPPYGLHPNDQLEKVPRVKAALALCHTRFDVNVGVAMRSAEAAGLAALYVMDSMSFSKRSTRGAELAIPLHHVPDAQQLIYHARQAAYQIVAVQQTPHSKPYHQVDYPPCPLFVLGAEDVGLPNSLRVAADLVVEIPLYGLIDSLNVASAATCVIMHWRTHYADRVTYVQDHALDDD